MTFKNTLQALGLRHRPWEPIKNKAVSAVEPQPILNQLDNDLHPRRDHRAGLSPLFPVPSCVPRSFSRRKIAPGEVTGIPN